MQAIRARPNASFPRVSCPTGSHAPIPQIRCSSSSSSTSSRFATTSTSPIAGSTPTPSSPSSTSKSSSSSSSSSELFKIISSHVKTHGPLPLPRYIALCLSHPTLGYYTRSQRSSKTGDQVIGAKGDFVTSPEISQVFGELLAIWYITQWQAQGMPRKTRIVELGPGRGTLMDDMLRTFRSIRGFSQTLTDVHLVETSPYMRSLQEKKLSSYSSSIRLHWHERIQDIPPTASPSNTTTTNDAAQGDDTEEPFTMVIAHEFFDALPIHAFEKRSSGFRELFVDLDPKSRPAILTGDVEKDSMPSKLRYVISPSPTLASKLLVQEDDPRFKGYSEGMRVEVCPEAYEIAQYAAELVGKKGAGLVIDYGQDQVSNTSFRAFKQHRLVDPLDEPGQADLTSNVDFSFLREALTTKRPLPLSSSSAASSLLQPQQSGSPSASTDPCQSNSTMEDLPPPPSPSNITVPPLLSQRSFLLSLGLQPRIQKLVDSSNSDQRKEDLIRSAQRLVEKNEKIHGMGRVFKVLGFVPQAMTGNGDGKTDVAEVFPFGQELD